MEAVEVEGGGFPGGSDGKEFVCYAVSLLGREDPLEKEMATPPPDSCLESPMDRGAWLATVQRIKKSWIQLNLCVCVFEF